MRTWPVLAREILARMQKRCQQSIKTLQMFQGFSLFASAVLSSPSCSQRAGGYISFAASVPPTSWHKQDGQFVDSSPCCCQGNLYGPHARVPVANPVHKLMKGIMNELMRREIELFTPGKQPTPKQMPNVN